MESTVYIVIIEWMVSWLVIKSWLNSGDMVIWVLKCCMSWQKSDAYRITDCIRRFQFVNAESYEFLWNIGVWCIFKGAFIDILCENA